MFGLPFDCAAKRLEVKSRAMRIRLTLLFLALGVSVSLAQVKPHSEGTVLRVDPALDEIVPPNATIEKLAEGFKFTEGPIWFHAGYLLFTDIPNNSIMKWTPAGELTVFKHPSGYSGTEPFKGPEPGSNGMTLDKQGRLTIAGHAARCVWRVEKDGKFTVLTDSYEGKRFNSPNDVVWRSDGSLYFTDPPYGLETQSDSDPKKQLPFNGVFRWKDGKTTLIVKDLTRPNGIAFSPDEKFLYVAVSDAQHKVWMRYDVKPDGTVENGKVFFDATSSTEEGLPDGMKVDQKGNVYGTGPGGIWIFSPEGKHLGTIKVSEIPANCNWGDEGRTLYMTARTGLYRIRLKIPGVRP